MRNRTLRIDIDPVPWTRPRTSNWVGSGAGRRRIDKPIVFDTPKLRALKEAVQWAARAAGPAIPCDGPVALTVISFIRRPKKPKFALPAVKPDADNLAKGIKDALNGIWYNDDSQVVDLHSYKRYADTGAIVVLMRDPNDGIPVLSKWRTQA